MNISLDLQEICKNYGDFVAVDRLSLSVPAGSIFGLLGPNGAGKTTTIRMIMNIIAPDSGAILFQGRPKTTKDLQRIGYLPEERGLYRKMSVHEQLVFLGRVHGLKKAIASTRATEWLERMELGDRADRKVEELSKGQQQKIQLAGTLLHDPELVILDEPFSGLDPINQGLFKDTLSEYKRLGKTIVFSTHIMEQAEKLCDNIALISNGKVVLQGNLAAIKADFGEGGYRIRGFGSVDDLKAIDGVTGLVELDDYLHLELQPGFDPARFLAQATSKYQITEFAPTSADLEEIFVRTIRDAN